MKFSPEFFDDEVREDFYVSGFMKRLWAANLEVIADIARVCEKHNIRWFADYGTLLGAVRHGGCIPWDDDFDICMLRDDYMRFIEVAEDELPDNYSVLNCHNEYEDILTRVVNNRHPFFDEELLEKYHNCYVATGVDIFPLDYMAPTEEEQEAHKVLIQTILSARPILEDKNLDKDELNAVLDQLEQLCDVKFDRDGKVLKQILQAAEGVCALYGPEGADKVMLASIWSTNGTKSYPLSCFQNAIKVKFEGIDIWISAEYDKMLRIEYGDYTRIMKGGASHAYPYFADQEQHVKEQLPEYPFEYTYNPKDMEETKRLPKQNPKAVCLRFATLMRDAHGKINRAAIQGNADGAFTLFQSCQNAAIGIGTMLEEQFGEGYFPVKILEEYCEALYQACENIHVYAEAKLGDILDSVIIQFEEAVQQLCQKKEIVIIPYRASSWGTIEAVWRQHMEDESCHVTVLLPPYYEKNAFGGFTTMHDESGLLPDYVEVTPYDAYDFEKKHPDVIYTQNPYDECNYTSSVHPFFYARNLKKFTEKLVYIPWFTMHELNPANGKAYQTMKYFCTVPGVVLADEVVLPSESIRDAYMEKLVDMAGENKKKIWEKKLVVKEIPVVDTASVQVFEKLPETWGKIIRDEHGNKKPIVVYDISPTSFIEEWEQAMKKLTEDLLFFEQKQKEVAFIWRHNSVTEDVLSAIVPDVYAKYKQIKDSFCERNWGILDDVLSYEEEASIADAYYGDAGYVSRRFETCGKPVMLRYIPSDQTYASAIIPRLAQNEAGDYPFHIRAFVQVEDLLYFIPDECNLLCTMHMETGEISILSSVPEEKINQTALASKLVCYNEKIILVPYMAKSPWVYEIADGSWKKIEIRNQEQAWKFSSSELYQDKLYMFPAMYKVIICMDLNTYDIKYFEEIYHEFYRRKKIEHCNLRAHYAKVKDTLYLSNYNTNDMLKFSLADESYVWLPIGGYNRINSGITWDGQYFYFAPLNRGPVLRWDGEEGFTAYPIPENCKYDINGPVSANILDGKLIMQGYQCDTIVYDLQDMEHGYTIPERYQYIFKIREDCLAGYEFDSYKFIIQDSCNRMEYPTVFNKDMLQDYLTDSVLSGKLGLSSVAMQEDAVVDKDYLVRCLCHDTKKKTIIFLPYKASMWDSMESIWFAAKEDAQCEVYVIPIAYYDKDAHGNLTTYHYEGELFPSYVPVTDYKAFDIKMHSIDVVYIHNPYDDGNHVTSIDPAYYSAELKNYTKKLVYVPYYATAGGMSEAQSLCKAYLHADYIVVQAEGHKDYFDLMIPREKLLALGSPKFDRVRRLCDNPPKAPEAWKNRLSGKRVYFYNTSLGGMLADTEAFLKKMRYVFRCFESRKDVCLIWRPHPLLDTTFETSRSKYKVEFEEIKRNYIEQDIGIYDTTADIEQTIALCDAYIGDSGTSVTALFGIVGKPVYLLDNYIHREPQEDDIYAEMISPYLLQGQEEWMVTAGNQLYHMEERYQYRHYCNLSEYSAGGYYRLARKRGDNIFVFPANAQDILVVHSQEHIEVIKLENMTSQWGAFANVWFYKQYAFLIPFKYQYIVRLNMDTYEVDYVDGCREFVVTENQGGSRIGGSCIWNGYLVVASPSDRRVMAIECETLTLELLSVEEKYYRGACAIQPDGEELWLLPSAGTNVVRWNPNTGESGVYNCRVPEFTCYNRPMGRRCMEQAFGSLVGYKDTVILAPLWGNQFVQIDKTSGNVRTFVSNIDFTYQEDQSYHRAGGNGCFVRMLDEQHALFYHETMRGLYSLDLESGDAEWMAIQFDAEDVKSHAPGFSRLSKWCRYGCMECAGYSLPMLLDGKHVGASFDKEACLDAYREIAVCPDGGSGKAIHTELMRRL